MRINIFNTTSFLQTAGYVGLFVVLYAETGLLIGLILPGESLLFTAGFLSSLGYLHLWVVLVVAFVAAALADSTGYALGKKYGKTIFNRPNSLFFNADYVKKAEKFYARNGGKTLIIARFLPFIRTLAPIFAGIGEMNYALFLKYNLIGAFSWVLVIGLSAYFLGHSISNANHYILFIALAAVVVFMVPMIIPILRQKANWK